LSWVICLNLTSSGWLRSTGARSVLNVAGLAGVTLH